MRILIDTHIFLWFIQGDERLPFRWKTFITESDHDFLISHVVPWEITIKHALGKLKLEYPPQKIFPEQILSNGFEFLPISLAHILRQGTLENHHRDPFDRMLAAQCEVEKIQLISLDPQLEPYGVVLKIPG